MNYFYYLVKVLIQYHMFNRCKLLIILYLFLNYVIESASHKLKYCTLGYLVELRRKIKH